MSTKVMRSRERLVDGLKSAGELASDLWHALSHLFDDGGTLIAGHMAFATLFALFPFLIFLTTLAGELGQSVAAEGFIEMGLESLPPDVSAAVEPALSEVLKGGRQGLMTVSIIAALWAVSSAIEAARYGMNLAYDVKDQRAFWRQRLQSLVMVLIFSFAIILAMVIVIAAPLIWSHIEFFDIDRDRWRWLYRTIRFGLSVTLMLSFVLPLYRWLPHLRHRFADTVPGALLAVSVWMISASLYSWYLQNLGYFTITYGSLGGIVATLLFFYISSLILLLGAEFNSARRRRLARQGLR